MSWFVDSNVILDLVTNDPVWREWSEDQLGRAQEFGGCLFNDLVLAEVSVRYDTLEEVEDLFTSLRLTWVPLPRHALFAAAKASKVYKDRGGLKPSVLPDFFIGAHAEHLEVPLLTRDVARYRTYFPQLELISP